MPNADDDIPLRTTRLRDLPPELAPAAIDYGLWNRPDRPKIVGIVGWVTTAIGYVAFTIKGGTLFHYFSDMRWLNPDYIAPVLTRNQYAAEVMLTLADIAIGLVAVAGGLGTLKMREWGRRVLIGYALAALVVGLLKALYQFENFDAVIVKTIAASTAPADRQPMENRAFFFFVTSTLMMAVWPLLVIGILTRRHVRQAFARAGGVALADDAHGFASNGDAHR